MSNPGKEIATSCRLLRLGASFVKNALTFTGDSHQEYMLKVLSAEVEYRELKRRDLNLKKAGFGNVKTFENYHFENIELPAVHTPRQIEHIDRVS